MYVKFPTGLIQGNESVLDFREGDSRVGGAANGILRKSLQLRNLSLEVTRR